MNVEMCRFFKVFIYIFLIPSTFLFGNAENDFFRACLNGDLAKVIEIYNKQGTKVTSCRDKDKNTPLHLACCSKKGGNKKEIVHFLIANEADVNAMNVHGSTPLFIAVSNENVQATELLLQCRGIKVNQPVQGLTPLHAAVINQSSSLIKLLLNHKAINPNFGTTDGATPLHFAAMMGFIEEAKLLIEHPKVNVNASQHDSIYSGATPLHFAAMQGEAEIVDALLKTNRVRIECRLDRGDYEGFTPLHFAVLNPDTPNVYATLQLLLQAGADPKAKCKMGKRAIDLTSVKLIQSLLNDPKQLVTLNKKCR